MAPWEMSELEQQWALSENNKELQSKKSGNKNAIDDCQKFGSFGVGMRNEASDQRLKPRDATSIHWPKIIFNHFKKTKCSWEFFEPQTSDKTLRICLAGRLILLNCSYFLVFDGFWVVTCNKRVQKSAWHLKDYFVHLHVPHISFFTL